MNHNSYEMVRTDCLDSLDRFVTHGIPTGGFLEAVLENNLMESFGRADNDNRYALFDICRYVYNELPASCHGSSEKVAAWLKMKAEEKAKFCGGDVSGGV